jgi:hypothetical protein
MSSRRADVVVPQSNLEFGVRVNRYYDPATMQFSSVDPEVAQRSRHLRRLEGISVVVWIPHHRQVRNSWNRRHFTVRLIGQLNCARCLLRR